MGIAKKALRFVASVAPLALSFIPGVGTLLGIGLSLASVVISSALRKKPKVSQETTNRLHSTIDPATARKIVLGRTAMATDVRYHAYTGTNQEYYEQILCVASHKVEAIEEIWFDTELAWTSAGGAQGRFAGYLTVVARLEGSSSNTVTIDSNWGTSQRLTGCAYLHLKFKLTGNTKKAESPFSQSVPTRVTVRGKGAMVPDPRLSTSAGGSGSQSMTSQSTWLYTTAADSGRNPACQLLFYLLGWKIGTKLALGLGMPSTRIDFASFITAANICDESVAKSGGGTEPRYRSDGIFSEDDDPETVLTSILQSMNGELTDENGKIALRIDYNDLASPVVALTEADIIDGDDWRPTDADQDVNVVRGKFTDPSDGALYQLVDYPQVTLTGSDYGSPDGIQRIEAFDLPMVQSFAQAQRLAKLRLQRKQYPGIFTARFNMRAWAASYGRPVTLSHASLGFSAKKFRVVGQKLRVDGTVELTLREHETAQYSWSAEEAAVATPAPPTAYNPLNSPLIQALEESGTSALAGYLTNETDTVPADAAGNVTDWSSAGGWFKVFLGTEDVSADCTFEKVSETGGSFTVQTYGFYSLTSMSADGALCEMRAIHTPSGAPIDKTFTVKKSKQGAAGAASKILTVISDRQNIAYDSAGAPTPTTQTTTFSTNKVNTTATVNWTITDINGVARTPTTSFLSAATGDSVTMTEAQFASARNGTSGVIVTGTVTDGVTLSDKISVIRVAQGATGPQGPQGATGPAGEAGSQGPSGPAGETLYTWIAYASNATGTADFTTGTPSSVHTYIGIANNKTTSTEGTNPAEYTWSLIQGSQGVPGTPGANGAPTYTWFAYASNATGTENFTTGAPTAGHTFVGIAANKSTATESSNPADYTWSLMQGANTGGDLVFDDFTYATQAEMEKVWAHYTGAGEFSSVPASESPGGKIVRFGSNGGDDSRWNYWIGDPIPYDPNVLYELTWVVRRISGSGLSYLGVEGLAADRTTMVNRIGANLHGEQFYVAAFAAAPGASWTTYKGYFKGKTGAPAYGSASPDPTNPAPLHSNVVFIRPMAYVNDSAPGQTELSMVRLRKVDGLHEINAEKFAQITGPSEVVVEADSAGALVGSSPYSTAQFLLMESGAQVTTGITWTRDTPAGVTTSISGTGTGVLDVTGMTSNDPNGVEVTLTASRTDRQPRFFKTKVRKNMAAPPAGGGSGGGTGGSSASQTSGFVFISSSTVKVISQELEVTVGSGGTVTMNSALNSQGAKSSPDGIWKVRYQWERWNGSAWVTQGSAFDASDTQVTVESGTYFPFPRGSVSNSQTYSSTAGATVKMRLTAWINPTGSTNTTKTINFTGQASLQG